MTDTNLIPVYMDWATPGKCGAPKLSDGKTCNRDTSVDYCPLCKIDLCGAHSQGKRCIKCGHTSRRGGATW